MQTVAILPVSSNIPITNFAHRLRSALEETGAPAAYLNQASVVQVMGRHAFTRMGKLKLAGWLAETEQNNRIVLFVADTTVSSPWTQTCIRRADCILLVAHGGGDPSIGDYERLLVGMKTTARKELVLLHPERFVVPGTTRPFLQVCQRSERCGGSDSITGKTLGACCSSRRNGRSASLSGYFTFQRACCCPRHSQDERAIPSPH